MRAPRQSAFAMPSVAQAVVPSATLFSLAVAGLIGSPQVQAHAGPTMAPYEQVITLQSTGLPQPLPSPACSPGRMRPTAIGSKRFGQRERECELPSPQDEGSSRAIELN